MSFCNTRLQFNVKKKQQMKNGWGSLYRRGFRFLSLHQNTLKVRVVQSGYTAAL